MKRSYGTSTAHILIRRKAEKSGHLYNATCRPAIKEMWSAKTLFSDFWCPVKINEARNAALAKDEAEPLPL